MKKNSIFGHLLAITIVLGPTLALAADHDQGHGRDKGKSHGNNPKEQGRHDNGKHKGWYKNDHEGDRWNGDEDRDVRGWRPSPQYRQSPSSISSRRQQTKNEWRNIAIGSGAVGLLGLLTKDSRLTFAGAAGALYSAYRYEQDRKSQNSIDRARAAYFSRPYFVRDGQRFDRRSVTKGGQRYYQFVRHR